ncbi:MAG: sigma-70 family RNA polymerase sigma factor [Muribaculaceae bacterium]|nr:sigma-70 family RNA polymerase sigma factor [Muribaculaceae bacterium]
MQYKTPIDEKKLVADLQNEATARSAFDLLTRTYGEQLYWQIRKMVASHDDANDLLQNCFIKAWKNISQFRGDARLSTWLYKIAVNESINFLHKERQRIGLTEEDDDSFLLQNVESDPYFDGDELQLQLQKAILQLPEKQRLVFNMKYYDDMKYEEISEVLGTSVGALKASYHHAVKKITSIIENSEIV